MATISTGKLCELLAVTHCRCAYCGLPFHEDRPPSIDHIIPRHDGGTSADHNLNVCCSSCNSSKGNRPLEWFRNQLQKRLSVAPLLTDDVRSYLAFHNIEVPQELGRFVFWFEAVADGMTFDEWMSEYVLAPAAEAGSIGSTVEVLVDEAVS